MRYLIGLLALALTAMLPGSSLACGVGVEDKVAATYDHAVVTRAGAVKHLVVFGEIDGAVNIKAVTADMPAAANGVPGIDRGTVRTSASPPAFSFALDPAAQAPASAVAALQNRLRTQGVKLSVLRVMSSDTKAARN